MTAALNFFLLPQSYSYHALTILAPQMHKVQTLEYTYYALTIPAPQTHQVQTLEYSYHAVIILAP